MEHVRLLHWVHPHQQRPLEDGLCFATVSRELSQLDLPLSICLFSPSFEAVLFGLLNPLASPLRGRPLPKQLHALHLVGRVRCFPLYMDDSSCGGQYWENTGC